LQGGRAQPQADFHLDLAAHHAGARVAGDDRLPQDGRGHRARFPPRAVHRREGARRPQARLEQPARQAGRVPQVKEPRYGWVMVALGAFMTCIAIGAMFSLAVFLRPITEATGWSTTAVSSAMTLNFLAMGAAGFGWGALSDRIGPRWVVLAGAV